MARHSDFSGNSLKPGNPTEHCRLVSYAQVGTRRLHTINSNGFISKGFIGRTFTRFCGKRWAEVLVLTGLIISPDVTPAEVAARVPRQVLILESFGRDMAPWNAITPAFKTELVRQLQEPIEFHETAVETVRDEKPQAERAFVEYLRALYERHPPELVVPVGAPAAQFWQRYRQSLFPDAPVLMAGLENRLLTMMTYGSKDAAVGIQFDARASLEVILEVLPATTNIAVVIGNSPLERFWMAECQRAWEPLNSRCRLEPFNSVPFSEMCRQAASLPPGSVVAYGMVWVDAEGVPHEQLRALDQLCAAANVPVFGMYEEQLGRGIVGGRLYSGETLGREAGRIAKRMLKGASAVNIPPLVIGASKPTFDWRELHRWQIEERLLPPGSEVRFRQPSVWQRYRWYMLGVFGIMVAQAATIISLMFQHSRRRRAEAAAYELSGRLIAAQENERRHLAVELHDGLGQDLLVIASQAQLSLRDEDNPPGTVTRLNDIAATARQALQQARSLAHNLRPGLVDELGFTKAVKATARKAGEAAGLSMAVELENVDGLLRPEFEVNLFRVIQETLSNILKHAGASEAKVTLTRTPTVLRAVVADNGCGFDPSLQEAATPDQRGFGLHEISQRVKMMGGRVDVQSQPGMGTRLTVELPLSEIKKVEQTTQNENKLPLLGSPAQSS